MSKVVVVFLFDTVGNKTELMTAARRHARIDDRAEYLRKLRCLLKYTIEMNRSKTTGKKAS
jgi:site-specific recombinase